MMNVNKEEQKHPHTIEKKLNKGRQPNRKLQRFKRNQHRQRDIITKTISNKISGQSKEQQDMIQFRQDKIFSMPEHSLVKRKNYDPHFRHGSNTDPTPFLFDYSIISNIAFKEMLLTETTTGAAADNTRINSFVESWNNEETWTSTLQLTQLINRLNYLKLQDEQWAYYYHLGVTEGIWTGWVSKRMARDNSMCYTYGRSKHIIEQRRKKFQRQLKQIKIDIDQHMTQTSIPLCDLNTINSIVTDLVAKNQYPLRVEFERRKAMLQFDAKDHQCIQAFYDLKPSQTQVRVNLTSDSYSKIYLESNP